MSRLARIACALLVFWSGLLSGCALTVKQPSSIEEGNGKDGGGGGGAGGSM